MSIRPAGVRADGSQLRQVLGLPAGPPEHLTGVTLDSRRVRPGDLYAALPGYTTHGARFAAQAVAAGAAALLTDPEGAAIVAAAGSPAVPVLVVPDVRAVLGEVSAWLYGRPADALSMTGITGTNGKTTVSYLLDAALRAGGRRTGVIGTVATQVGDEVLPAVRTTPESPDVHASLAVMRQRGCSDVTMEVSSHALQLGRVDGITFDLAVFTNLSQDHLDFHGDMDSYFEAKAALFTASRARAALVCTDDEWGQRLARRADAAGLTLETYRLDGPADWVATDVRAGARGVQDFTARGPGIEVDVTVGLAGRFNVANALAALAAAVQRGVPAEVAAQGIRNSPGVPGRMERVADDGGRLLLVDYAHTPDAVERALVAAREVTAGRVVCVMGCGGDRDRAKRPPMGQVAARNSDILLITDDNPRSESPAAIRADIMAGVQQVAGPVRAEVREVGDRHRAIRDAVAVAGPGDTVIVLGKGHEQGQEVAGVVSPFDDRAELRAALEEES